DICGYGFHIGRANAGTVLDEPFQQERLNNALLDALTNKERLQVWSDNAIAYANRIDLYSLAQRAADIIVDHCHD
ncbi:MAG: glycosyltransferase family 1 protein, partial [Enterobacteriaceae bacterium]